MASEGKPKVLSDPKGELRARRNYLLPWDLLAGGAGAGAIAAFVTSPLDVTRTRLQIQRVGTGGYSGVFGTLRIILAEEGIRGWYRGLGSNLIALVPNWCIYFTSYEKLKKFGEVQGLQGPLLHMFSAVGAGAITDVVVNPLWLIKIRFQTQNQLQRLNIGKDRIVYRNTFHAFRTIVKQEGVFALWNGLGAQLMGLSHVAVQFPLYEVFKSRLRKADGTLSPVAIFGASTAAKVIACCATYPHEVIRARFQSQSPTDPHRYLDYRHAIRDIKHREGIKGFYRGIVPTLMRSVPSCGITFTLYEVIQRNVALKMYGANDTNN